MIKYLILFIFPFFLFGEIDHEKIHLGENKWIDSIKDQVEDESIRTQYVKQWKCPYCYKFWNEGQACQNSNCPSRYKTSGFTWSNLN